MSLLLRRALRMAQALALAGIVMVMPACGGGADIAQTAPASSQSQPLDAASQPVRSTPAANTTIAPADTTASGDAIPAAVTPTSAPAPSFEEQMLQAVNAARAQARVCGSVSYPAAPALRWNDKAEQAAQIQADYLQQNNLFSHDGANGSNVGDRLTSTGYVWGAVGENLAAGYIDIASVMQGWIDSPGHCANLMHASFTEIGVSQVQGVPSNTYRNYWGMVLATPR